MLEANTPQKDVWILREYNNLINKFPKTEPLSKHLLLADSNVPMKKCSLSDQ